MTPAGPFPSADEIAAALVAAADWFREPALLIVHGKRASRARHVAYEALRERFPAARRNALARCCGYPHPENARTQTRVARGSDWWTRDAVAHAATAIDRASAVRFTAPLRLIAGGRR